MNKRASTWFLFFITACGSPDIEGIYPATPAATTVKYDFFHRPLPDIPLPNDIATRADTASPTGLRLNASLLGPSQMESKLRERIATLDGWGLLQAIAIPFTAPLDPNSIVMRHREANYDTSNDAIYLVNIDRDSPEFGQLTHLDLGQGNYPAVTVKNRRLAYGPIDPRSDTLSILFEEADEDVNDNGVMDPGEDTDADGVLDRPNYLPGAAPAADDVAGRSDALMRFYEQETNTLLATPLVPLRERTTYAVIVTKRLLDQSGAPVGSPFAWIHHSAQTEALRPLPEVLPAGLTMDDVAFAFTYTTQTVEQDWIAVRDGLYGLGPQAHIGRDFAPEVTKIFPLLDESAFPDLPSHLLKGELWRTGMTEIIGTLLGEDLNSNVAKWAIESITYCDFIVMGAIDGPQLMPRRDASGTWLPFDQQVWPPDLSLHAAPAYREKIYFTLAVPRKEVSVRGQGQPAPLMIMLHGHTGNRYSATMADPGNFCKQGIATLAFDGPTHGISISAQERQLAFSILDNLGFSPLGDAIFSDRAVDQNKDGEVDTGADFWTSYMFHTRDMVRQFAMDTSSMVRVLRAFDGTRRWNFDIDDDGQIDIDGLAGDFDGDGVIDVGGTAPIVAAGGSLGGMMAMLAGSLEPEISAVVPVVGGGALSSIGPRSSNGGARTGFIVRAMSQIYLGETRDGSLVLRGYLPSALDIVQPEFVALPGALPGDMLVIEDVITRERGCGQVAADGTLRANVPTAVGNGHRVTLYQGPLVVGTECEVTDAAIRAEATAFDRPVVFEGTTLPAGSPIIALVEGMGLRRANPEFRRATGIGQLILDRGDPGVYARHLQTEPLVFGTGERTGAHALLIMTAGDPSVPVAAGMTMARSAGLLPYLETDLRYGRPANQVLIDGFVAEGSNEVPRYFDNTGAPVVLDVENLSAGRDLYEDLDLPRLDPPLRLGVGETDRLGGHSAVLFVMVDPKGSHGFGEAGRMEDLAYQRCVEACLPPGTPETCNCQAESRAVWDTGRFVWNLMGRFAGTIGTEIKLDECHEANDCPYFPPLPPSRLDQ